MGSIVLIRVDSIYEHRTSIYDNYITEDANVDSVGWI